MRLKLKGFLFNDLLNPGEIRLYGFYDTQFVYYEVIGYSNAVILNPSFIGPFKISTDHYHAVVVSALCACVYKQDGFAH